MEYLILHSNDFCVYRLKYLLYVIPALDLSCIYLSGFMDSFYFHFCVKSALLCLCAFVAVISVSSFVKKTTEKINNLQMNSDLWPRPDHRDGQEDIPPDVASCTNEVDTE